MSACCGSGTSNKSLALVPRPYIGVSQMAPFPRRAAWVQIQYAGCSPKLMLGSSPCRRLDPASRQAPQVEQVFRWHLVNHDQISPSLGQLDPPLKVFRPIVGALHDILRHVGQHQIDDVPIVLIPLIHYSRECCPPSMRHMAVMVPRPI